MAVVIDLGVAALILGHDLLLSMSEGLWGAALMFFNILFAGVIAFNFYEPLARLITEQRRRAGRTASPTCSACSSCSSSPCWSCSG